MKVFVIVGTRPEAIKMAPVYSALHEEDGLHPLLISTGQHREMLDQVLDRFGLTPDHELEIMAPNQTQSQDKSRSNVEAGLRTRNLEQPFPEEGYRQMASRVAAWHFCPTRRAQAALEAETVGGEAILVGNTVVDALVHTAERVDTPQTPLSRERLVLITGHRRENHGDRFNEAFDAIATLAETHADVDFVYPVHLNPNVRDSAFERLSAIDNMSLIEPVAYPEMVALMKRATMILTDSGGVQEEAPTFGVPVLVMRDATERQEAVEAGACELVGVDKALILNRARAILDEKRTVASASHNVRNPFGDGHAAKRIASVLADRPVSPYER